MLYELKQMEVIRYPVKGYTLDNWTADRIKEIKIHDVGLVDLPSGDLNKGDMISLKNGNWVVDRKILVANQSGNYFRLYVEPYQDTVEKRIMKQTWKERIPLFPDREKE